MGEQGGGGLPVFFGEEGREIHGCGEEHSGCCGGM